MSAQATTARPGAQERIRAALWFAEHGFGVFSCWSTRADGTCRCPAGTECSSPGKHPITQNGFQDAITEPDRIRTLLSAGSDPNYGLVCPEGVFAWDVDGVDWKAEMAALEARLGPLPPTLRTETKHGLHIFLRWPEGLPRPLRKMFGYVTRWGSGKQAGYVIGPRSVHSSGFEYTPAGVFEIATLPDTWARAVVAAEDVITITGTVPAEQVTEGHRHDWLRNTARHYAGTVRDPDALKAAVMAANAKLPQPKPEADVDRAIGEALTKFPADATEEDPATGAIRRVPADELGMLPPVEGEEFPAAPVQLAFGGLLGECVESLLEGTDASAVGMLASMVAFCGALCPVSAYFNREQTSSPFLALVGESSVGRKGTAMHRVADALSDAIGIDKINTVKLAGLASGEGLVNTLHERQVSDFERAALVFEEEYATHLAAQGRDGSTLDPRMRQAFDGGQMHHRRVSGSIVVKEPYWLSAIIAITPSELRAKLPGGALLSGSGNRWLWVPVVKRAIRTPNIQPQFPQELREAIQDARRATRDKSPRLDVENQVSETLGDYSEYLWSESVGIAADMTRRYTVIAFRVALVHAALERAARVTIGHLRRAIALTEYARAGLGWVFGESLGNRDATNLLRHLKAETILSQGSVSKYLIRDPLRRQDAIDELVRLGLAQVARVPTSGRTRTELRLVPEKGTFRAFFAWFPTEPKANRSISADNVEMSVDHSAEGARNLRGSGRNTDGSDPEDGATRAPAREDSIVDTTTGEVATPTTAKWARPCRDYTAHRDDHRNSAEGWFCLSCDAQEKAP